MRILFFGVYNPSYSRNRVLMRGLRANDIEIIECRTSWGPFWILKLLVKYIRLWPSFDYMLVPFRGHPVMLIARWFTSKPIIFDAFTSEYEGYILDRKRASVNSFRAKYYRWLDRVSCMNADLVLLDTREHVHYFITEFKIPREKFCVIYVGTDRSVMKPLPEIADNFRVHFHGHYIPLHGTKYIIETADQLKLQNVTFQMIGRGLEYGAARKLAMDLGVDTIEFRPNISYEELPEAMAHAHICLGIFGETSKVGTVIPNKVFEALACKRALITADTPAIRELLTDGEHALLVPAANPEALAHAILRLKQDADLRKRIAENGYTLLQTRLQEHQVVEPLLTRIHETISLRT
jgi:glycosyltransferase involved in cell wall biosynthesis